MRINAPTKTRNGFHAKLEVFFDRKAVVDAVGRDRARALSKAGAFVQRRAKTSIRKRKKASNPGSPPSSHKGQLRDLLFFSFDPTAKTVVVGPVGFSTPAVPGVLEHSGTSEVPNFRRQKRKVGDAGEIRIDQPRGYSKSGRRRRFPPPYYGSTKTNAEGRWVVYTKLGTGSQAIRANQLNQLLYGPKTNRVVIAARPFMLPALAAEQANFAGCFANSIRP